MLFSNYALQRSCSTTCICLDSSEACRRSFNYAQPYDCAKSTLSSVCVHAHDCEALSELDSFNLYLSDCHQMEPNRDPSARACYRAALLCRVCSVQQAQTRTVILVSKCFIACRCLQHFSWMCDPPHNRDGACAGLSCICAPCNRLQTCQQRLRC